MNIPGGNLRRKFLRFDNQLCLGIIASGIGFVLAQRTLFRFRDIRRRLNLFQWVFIHPLK